MNIIELPFVEKVGIQKSVNGTIELPYTLDVQNHIHTIHAGAQFTLAETSSGAMLLTLFPDLINKVIPVLRESKIKFKKPATKSICAFPTVSDASREKFNEQYKNKGRALISVDVEVREIDGTVTCISTFSWFLQRIEK